MKDTIKKDITQASHKISLLVILFAGVFCAWVIVSVKSNIWLDKPIKLGFTGFSVPLPSGENWETKTGEWVFDNKNNYFYVGAIEKQKGITTAVVQWRYIISPEGKNIDEILKTRGEQIGGQYSDKTPFVGDGFGAYLTNFRRNMGENVYLAIIILEPGRAAELEIRGRDQLFCSDVFQALLKGAKFETNGLINKGRLLTEVASSNLSKRQNLQSHKSLYLFNSQGLMNGFSGTRQLESESVYAVKSIMFASDGVFDIYRRNELVFTPDRRGTWKFTQKGLQPQDKREILIELSPSMGLVVSDFTARTNKSYNLGNFAWFEIVDYELFYAFIKSEFDVAIVDFVSSQGIIMPALLKRNQESDNLWKVSLQYLNSSNAIEISIDKKGYVLSRKMDTDYDHKLEKCSREDILARFPQHSAFLQEFYE